MSDHPAVKVLEQAADIMRRKAQDYTREDTDAFDNFREVARMVGITEEQVIRAHIANKVARLNNLFARNTEAEFESIDDNLLDLINYVALLKAWRDQPGVTRLSLEEAMQVAGEQLYDGFYRGLE